jgi:uncharacterized protein YbcC (UPF0753/DUF2309 family)
MTDSNSEEETPKTDRRKLIEQKLTLAYTPQSLAEEAVELVRKDKMRYTEAIAHICETKEIDPSDIAKIISGPLLQKIEEEAINHHVISKRKGSSLDGV